jgi:undecaprenyl diphosphate synthase
MDGNGRWAASRGLMRLEGHRRGVAAVRRTVEAAGELGIRVLTLYGFSAENWSRPQTEVTGLMNLLRRFIRDDLATLHRANVRVRVIGERVGLEPDILALIEKSEELTRDNTGLILVVAFNYGARQELARAASALARAAREGEVDPGSITAENLGAYLDTADLPDPDLVIRTSGEQRISNFLLWQAAYAEFVFLPMHWPDFDRAALEQALAEFARRDRRFGGVGKRRPE